MAVKRLKEELIEMDESMADDFEKEVKFMRALRHRNIVFFFGAGRMGNTPFLVLEFMARGTLMGILHDASVDLSWERQVSFAVDGAKGLAFLHSQVPPRIHRDVKSSNMLVNEAWIVKVADFGT